MILTIQSVWEIPKNSVCPTFKFRRLSEHFQQREIKVSQKQIHKLSTDKCLVPYENALANIKIPQ